MIRLLLLALVLAGCVPDPTQSTGGTGRIEVQVVAGPVCPVEQEPPDPSCEPRPVAGAGIFVQPADGRDILVREAISGADGRATIAIAAGDYLVLGGDVEGLMGRPEPMTVTVRDGATATVVLTYDTGIR